MLTPFCCSCRTATAPEKQALLGGIRSRRDSLSGDTTAYNSMASSVYDESWSPEGERDGVRARLLQTEKDLQNKFGDSVLPVSLDPPKRSFRKQLRSDFGRIAGLVRGYAYHKKGTLPRTLADYSQLLVGYVPLIHTVRTYKRSYVAVDLSAGIAEGVMKVPQGMAYALLAKMPVEYGLYTSFVPPLMYFIFGTCSQMSLGVTAIEAALCASGEQHVARASVSCALQTVEHHWCLTDELTGCHNNAAHCACVLQA